MKTLQNKRVLLGVTGGIAAYKSAELVRRLRERGAEVQVVMTQSACEFITPLTMQALSGRPVYAKLLNHEFEAGMWHIELARWCDIALVAPSTANFISRLAHGRADDLLSTLCLVTDVQLLVAPAMNQQMWLNSATKANIAIIQDRNIKVLDPAVGDQACGESGPGRMLEPEELVTALESEFHTSVLVGTCVMITAGPTREAIDPVRYISSRSSGRIGYAIARAAVEAGAEVTLVTGPVSLSPPDQVRCVQVMTAEQMRSAVMSEAGSVDIFISAAAVADYRCNDIADQKIKSNDASISISLKKNPDILLEVAGLGNSPFTVGFAAETELLKENALKKLKNKGLDMIAANQVGDNIGFESEDNAIDVYWHNGSLILERCSKEKLARKLINVVAKNYYDKHQEGAH